MACTHATLNMWGGQRTTCGNWFSPSLMGFGDRIQVVRVSVNTSICCRILPAPIYNQSFLPSFPPSILLNVCIYVCMCTCVYVYICMCICVHVCMCIYVNLSVLAPHTHTAITPTR